MKGGVAPLIPDPVLARQPPETKKFNRNPSIHFDGARAPVAHNKMAMNVRVVTLIISPEI